MQYPDSIERSSEYLRLAIPLMAKQSTPRHPLSYAVWYEFVSGRNAALNAEIAQLTASGTQLSEAVTMDLYRKHVLGIDESTAERIKSGLERVLQEVAETTAESSGKAAAYGSTLEAWGSELQQGGMDADRLLERISRVVKQTAETQTSMVKLQSVLDESRAEVEELKAQLTRAKEEASTDALTGVTNRKGFDRTLIEMTDAAMGNTTDLCLMMVDIDHFKKINDTYGHVFGDKVIRTVAQSLKSSIKGRDLVARYGGEEFAVLLPETPAKGAHVVADQIRAQIEKVRIKRLDKDEYVSQITVSIGVTQYRPREDLAEFVSRADGALYASKSGGRNRVTLY